MADENAEQPNAGGEKDADAQNNDKSKKKLLFIVLGAALVLAAGGGGAAYFLLTPSADETTHTSKDEVAATESHKPETEDPHQVDAAPKDGATKKEGKEETAGTPKEETTTTVSNVDFGNTFSFKTFHLNLGNPLENHYIRLEIAVEYKGGEEQRKEIEQRLPQLRDAVVGVTSRKTREFLLGPDGKDQLRREILIRMNRYMNQPLESVFLTDILIE